MNTYSSDIIINSAQAALRTSDLQFSLQNYTGFDYNQVIGANKEASLWYPFTVATIAGGRNQNIQIVATYRPVDGPEHQYYRSVVHNSTVWIEENKTAARIEFSMLTGLIVIGIILRLFKIFF